MQCLASFFDAISGIKKQTLFMPDAFYYFFYLLLKESWINTANNNHTTLICAWPLSNADAGHGIKKPTHFHVESNCYDANVLNNTDVISIFSKILFYDRMSMMFNNLNFLILNHEQCDFYLISASWISGVKYLEVKSNS